MSNQVRHVAIFDLDGTLSWHDTFIEYLLWVLRRNPARATRLWRVPLAAIEFALHRFDRGLIKQRLIEIFLRGDTRSRIEGWSREFAAGLQSRGGLRPSALLTLERHRNDGDWLVLLSASPDLYVPEIGRLLGFHRTICTEVAFQGDRLTGRLTTPNRRGEEKLRCLEQLQREFPAATFSAYGNSASDIAHMSRVDRALLVNANSSARRQAGRLNMAVADWK